MVTYNSAYRLARISKWEQMARDRDRFQRRIQKIDQILIKVFNPVHRDYMLAKRLRENCLLSQHNQTGYDSKAV
jgi:Ni,Fe-hydrogenase III large subunit